jgi:glycerol-3-phosphate acyltransferase PlsY
VFVAGGLLFGAYLTFTFLLAWTNFNPVLETLKAFFVSLVALSTVSGFVFSIYICFGRKLGIALNVLALAVWQFVIPMGFLGIWTMMASARTFVVLAMLMASFVLTVRDRRKRVAL